MFKYAKYVMLVILLLVTGCTHNKQLTQTTTSAQKKTTIGFSMATLKEDRWLMDRDIFVAKAKNMGWDLITYNANNDSKTQFEQVKKMVDKGIDILVIVPNDSEISAQCVSYAKNKGIPVISYDRLVLKGNVDAYISFDNEQVGKLQGEYLATHVPNGNYVLINGSKDDNNSALIKKGYMSVLQPLINKGSIRIIGETWVFGWIREDAYKYMMDVLDNKTNKVDAILCEDDSLAVASIDALSVHRQIDKVSVVGHDADLVSCQKIMQGTQKMTVYKPISKLVDKTIDVCKELLNNNKLDNNNNVYDGEYYIPTYSIGVEAVTKDNMDDTIIKDGFHLAEDVYRKE